MASTLYLEGLAVDFSGALCVSVATHRKRAWVMKVHTSIRRTLAAALAAATAAGCSSLSHPPDCYDVDHCHDYIPHRDIGAKPGSPDKPDAGAGAIAGLLQFLVH
jgi:hypothetical protein